MRRPWGGKAVRSFIHGSDVAEATYAIALEAIPGEIFHLATNEYVSIKDLVFKICSVMGVDPENATRIVEDRPGKDQAYFLNTEKVEKEMGFRPQMNLATGIQQTIAWIQKNADLFRTKGLNYLHKP